MAITHGADVSSSLTGGIVDPGRRLRHRSTRATLGLGARTASTGGRPAGRRGPGSARALVGVGVALVVLVLLVLLVLLPVPVDRRGVLALGSQVLEGRALVAELRQHESEPEVERPTDEQPGERADQVVAEHQYEQQRHDPDVDEP